MRCNYNDNRDDRVHNGTNATIHGIQTASADDKTDDPVTMWFSFEDLGLDDNTVRARLYSATGRDARKAERTCKLPVPTPTFIAEATGTNSDGSQNTNFVTEIDGTTLSLWDKKDVLRGRSTDREKLIWHIDAFDKTGSFVDIGCCALEYSMSKRSLVRDYDRVYGPFGLQITAALKEDVED